MDTQQYLFQYSRPYDDEESDKYHPLGYVPEYIALENSIPRVIFSPTDSAPLARTLAEIQKITQSIQHLFSKICFETNEFINGSVPVSLKVNEKWVWIGQLLAERVRNNFYKLGEQTLFRSEGDGHLIVKIIGESADCDCYDQMIESLNSLGDHNIWLRGYEKRLTWVRKKENKMKSISKEIENLYKSIFIQIESISPDNQDARGSLIATLSSIWDGFHFSIFLISFHLSIFFQRTLCLFPWVIKL